MTGAIDSLANAALTVRRRAAGTYTAGVYTPGAESTFPIVAVVQPADASGIVGGTDLRGDLDGQSVVEVLELRTHTRLRTRTPTAEPDVVEHEGADWTVVRVETWTAFGQTHCRAIISRLTGGGS